MAKLRIGIDIGGTFTDLVMLDEERHQYHSLKVLSTPSDPTKCVLNAFDEIFKLGYKPEEVRFIAHGTTVATNALLEHKGAKTVVFITEGFRATPEVGDQTRDPRQIYSLSYERPPMLAKQRDIVEVPERINHDGDVVKALSNETIEMITSNSNVRDAESAAICFLFSFMNPSNEKLVADALKKKLSNISYISSSHDVMPRIREHIRMSTTIVDAYVGPILKKYLEGIESALQDMGISSNPFIVHSGGGMMTSHKAKSKAVWCIESGPAAGMIAASQVGSSAGIKKLIAFDMGGTTAKFGLVINNEPIATNEFKAGGYILGIPVLDLVEIGSGGGSIASVDAGGLLKVGPESAGSEPGPICYDHGGTKPTVTDADLVLGYLNPSYFVGGKLKLNEKGAKKGISEQVAKRLHLSLTEAAHGIFTVVNVHMAQALRSTSVERGFDPRDFVLVAFGGAGPVHAAQLALEAGIRRLVIPLRPGVQTSMGLINMDLKHEYVLSRLKLLDEVSPEEMGSCFKALEEKAIEEVESEGFKESQISIKRYLDMRYSGQGYELKIPISSFSGPIRNIFDASHEKAFGMKAEDQPIEIVTYRLVATARLPKEKPVPWSVKGKVSDAFKKDRRMYFSGSGFTYSPTYERMLLPREGKITGPCVVEQPDTTVVILPKQTATVDKYGNMVVAVQ
jgi:N-methylhydantoinase A